MEGRVHNGHQKWFFSLLAISSRIMFSAKVDVDYRLRHNDLLANIVHRLDFNG